MSDIKPAAAFLPGRSDTVSLDNAMRSALPPLRMAPY